MRYSESLKFDWMFHKNHAMSCHRNKPARNNVMPAKYSAAQIVALHNKYSDKPVKRFENSAKAHRRTLAAISAAGVTVQEALYAAGLETRPAVATKATKHQRAIMDLALRGQGVTGNEILAATGWPTIAARTYVEGLAKKFGYAFEYVARTGASPTTYRLLGR
jgi:hypothetical protein